MTEPTPTPGDWRISKFAELPSITIEAEGGFIARTLGGNDEANARPIAAAPKLLAACKNLVWAAKPEGATASSVVIAQYIEQGEAAIAEAERGGP